MDNIVSTQRDLHPEYLHQGAVLLIDKPLEWTSFDVVNKVRYEIRKKLNRKKYKVGHAGTLDPLATGLLVLCIGPYTKQIDEIVQAFKSYEADICIGATTPSADAEYLPDCYFPPQA